MFLILISDGKSYRLVISWFLQMILKLLITLKTFNKSFLKYLITSTLLKKTSIYSQPSNTHKKSSYFIAGDDVKSLSVNDDWIEVSYSNDTKRGWLSLRDLEKIAVTSSTEESNNKLSKNGFNDIHID